MDNPIITACEDARAVGHRVLGVSVERIRGRWQGRITLAVIPAGGLDRPKTPKGVACSLCLIAPPDIIVALPPLTSEELAEATISEVARIGGAVDWARFAREDGDVRFLTKPLAWGREDFRR